MKKGLALLAATALFIGVFVAPAAARGRAYKINVLLNTEITEEILVDLDGYGRITGSLESLDVVFMKATKPNIKKIRQLPFVDQVNRDRRRTGRPLDTVAVEDFGEGMSTWDMDAINVTDFGAGRTLTDYDGEGVYVAVLDTGLLDTWRRYFPEERIATEYAASVGGGGNERGMISWQPNKWEHDTNSHGTHVTSTILGFDYFGVSQFNGVAPMAEVIPVKVLNNNGSGWSSMVAAGIMYVAELKEGPLAEHPVVINMSLGGPALDAVEKAAIDHAIDAGVIIVASAGNEGEDGMGYPGAYAPVISVAASGWKYEWSAPYWWRTADVPESGYPDDYYIADFSSRELAGQDLDVAAPGTWVVGPYQINRGQISYYYLGGTSMASPHVAGIAALMMEKDDSLLQADVESILESAAIPMGAGSQSVLNPFTGQFDTISWGADATGAGLITADAALAAIP